MKKKCTQCKRHKDVSNFYRNSRRRDGYNSTCKACADVATKVARDKKKDKYSSLRKKARDKAIGRWSDWKRSQGCSYCEETEPVCLDLHHLDPNEKDYNPSALSGGNWKKLMEEASKCIVVCKNCHAKIHAGLL